MYMYNVGQKMKISGIVANGYKAKNSNSKGLGFRQLSFNNFLDGKVKCLSRVQGVECLVQSDADIILIYRTTKKD